MCTNRCLRFGFSAGFVLWASSGYHKSLKTSFSGKCQNLLSRIEI